MELGIDAVRGLGRWGEQDPGDQRAQYLAGFGLDAIVVERQLELGHLGRRRRSGAAGPRAVPRRSP